MPWQRYSKVVKLSKEEVNGKTEQWLVKGLVAMSLNRRVMADVAVWEFRLCARLKGGIFAFNLKQGFLLFHF